MKIKNKLRLGFAFLFIVVLFFGATSLFYIQQISKSAKVILKNNYETLNYTKAMRTILDEHTLPLDAAAIAGFKKQLVNQQHNVTEPGEFQATEALRLSFDKLQRNAPLIDLQQTERALRQYLRTIEELNMRAIVKKNTRAHESVNRATMFLGFVGGFTFLILFSFSVNFPDIINSPLKALLEGIREISHKNYSQRLNFNQNDEFGEVATAFNDMAARLNEWENSNLAKVLSEKIRIETIIEQMQDAIIGVNEKQEVLFINDAARNLLNLNEQKVLGLNIAELSKGNDLLGSIVKQDKREQPFKIVVNGKESFFELETREIRVPTVNENRRQDEINIASRPAGKVYSLKNITEFRERDEAKTNFIATISHELKTPISSIKMSLKLLKDERVGQINHEQRQLVEHIREDSDRLLKITSELLDLSQVETGNIQLNFVPSDPAAIVDYALNSVRFTAGQKQIGLHVNSDTSLPKVQVDVEKTAWVLVNFLSNALRYSPERSKIEISVKHHKDQVVFAVQDFGKGIDEQYQKRLFDRYFQVPTDGQNKAGSGLGLAISKDFIEAQNGRIWVESAIGEGSKFYFALPVYNPAAQIANI